MLYKNVFYQYNYEFYNNYFPVILSKYEIWNKIGLTMLT